MAKKLPPEHTRFKPGQSGNSGGRPKLTDKDRIVQKLTRETWNELSEKMMTCTKDQLEALIAAECPMEVETFIRHMLAINEDPDWHAYEKYLARRIGPVKQDINLTVHPKPTVINLLNGDKMILGTEGDNDE